MKNHGPGFFPLQFTMTSFPSVNPEFTSQKFPSRARITCEKNAKLEFCIFR